MRQHLLAEAHARGAAGHLVEEDQHRPAARARALEREVEVAAPADDAQLGVAARRGAGGERDRGDRGGECQGEAA